MTYKYLATPYTNPDPKVREERFRRAQVCLQWLLKNKVWTYSPIVHCHQMALDHKLPTDFQFWLDYNHEMILSSGGIIVYKMPGWEQSKGVAEEIQFARDQKLSIEAVIEFEGQDRDFDLQLENFDAR